MLVKLIKNQIAKGKTIGLKAKLDVYLLADSITAEEYQELISLLGERAE